MTHITCIFPDSYLQDVQEEDEEPGRGSGIARMLELSGSSQCDSSHVDGEDTDTEKLRAALEDLQAQNTMLQDELTLLSNVKSELEAELERAKEEFQIEREETDFKINELQMNRESAMSDPKIYVNLLNTDPQEIQGEFHQQSEADRNGEDAALCDSRESEVSPVHDHSTLNPEEQQKLNQEVRSQCEAELVQKTRGFAPPSNDLQEQAAYDLQDLQDKIRQLTQERDELLTRVREVTEEKNTLVENVQDLKLKLEGSPAPGEEQTALACELKQSVEELTRQNEEILSQLQMKENMSQDLSEMVNTLTEDRERIKSLLQLGEEDIQKLKSERLLEENEAQLLREESKTLKIEKEDEVRHLKEEREKMEASLNEEVERMQAIVSTFQLTIEDLSTEKADLHQKLEETFSGLSQTQEEKGLLGSKLAAMEAQLEQETSEKHHLEARLNSLTEEAEQSRNNIRNMEEDSSEALKNTKEEVEKLRICVDELEKERNLLRSSLEEAQPEVRLDEVKNELQVHIETLEQERNTLRFNMEEVLKDTEGLQEDLKTMKSLNEKIIGENQMLQAQNSLMSQEKDEKEKGEIENVEKERRELQDELTEKDSLVSELRGEIAALQVSAAPDVSGSFKINVSPVEELTDKVNLYIGD